MSKVSEYNENYKNNDSGNNKPLELLTKADYYQGRTDILTAAERATYVFQKLEEFKKIGR